MVLAYKRDQTLGQADESYSEGSLVDNAFYCVAGLQVLGTVPQARHEKRELFRERGFLEFESVA